jgi:5-methylcytosine-specific restriction endonuclease McrA
MGGRDVRVLAGGLVSRTNAGKPCPHIDRNGKSCPNLLPCATHPPRDRNASWSEGRNSTEQGRFRRATLARDGFTCRRCGLVDATGEKLDAHHVTPTRGMTLCNSNGNGCHAAVDRSAR